MTLYCCTVSHRSSNKQHTLCHCLKEKEKVSCGLLFEKKKRMKKNSRKRLCQILLNRTRPGQMAVPKKVEEHGLKVYKRNISFIHIVKTKLNVQHKYR